MPFHFVDIEAADEMDDFPVTDETRTTQPVAFSPALPLSRLAAALEQIINLSACGACASQSVHSTPTGDKSMTPKDKPPILPDRIIEIIDSSKPAFIRLRLLETKGARFGDYITLSHRWGGDFTLKTTRNTFPERLKGFYLTDMPRTFQDAVLIAEALQIKHLWIDSLCIIQGDRNDWLEQLAKMGSIYMNSAFTIATHSTGQCNEGFVWRSQVHSSLRIAPKQGGPSFVMSIPEPDDETLCQRILSSEISNRAWILQELTPSPRILYFIEDRVFLECEHRKPEVGSSVVETTAGIFRHVGDSPDMHTMWLRLVSRYTEYEMTKTGDKLAALTGVLEVWRKMMAKPEDSFYHCGVFQADIERSLLWYRAKPSSVVALDELETHLERAPSWSWASVDGRLRFVSLELREPAKMLMHVKGLEHDDYLSLTSSQPHCRL
ncbi:hypothetical protein QQZ08_008499 [Neonectria magnoliae]|uniref:Heterokaryon incompatibility domain-containing protein n=1 Tax=Neonectria magnoliae TaxID=2732573 RepID=A0ABR1HUC7_9HYPO